MRYVGLLLIMISTFHSQAAIRIATFNVSMEGDNYVNRGIEPSGEELKVALASGDHPQIRNIAEIIQRVRPDILLLNEFDYIAEPEHGVEAFVKHYLNAPQQGAEAIDYPYYYVAPVNTGVASGVDLSGDGQVDSVGDDAFGYGKYPGQYGMVLLSRFPIQTDDVRTFQRFLWKDMPDNLMVDVKHPDGRPWYKDRAQAVMRLSSKSHWDVPVSVNGKTLHLLASHPTPPVFDGPENRNGMRNHDEVRFWLDYLDGKNSAYIYDDNGRSGGLSDPARFVILGDLNASAEEGDGFKGPIQQLLSHPLVNAQPVPTSDGGREHRADNPHGATHTAAFGLRVDYVLPSSAGMTVTSSGIFWPSNEAPLARLVRDRAASSDHRMVWIDVTLTSD
ncbi:endonuclease/exonuclease/phosphatase family protein [Aestuariibacter halophilus]|uniref:Endonuclease/exonuclease/phosphatase family protein n=1 Tax=Fluctibacter halophilus TaxID=226011 RepID=A0ABS8G794_9ALTE|nr:endonuclease/exonuclease/phosphatase family protein [Aestuariibacter halophilus]MCC2616393.1 endonuclease/exonuclease/phosphatase family protein [Aestuariibacter halophilus]